MKRIVHFFLRNTQKIAIIFALLTTALVLLGIYWKINLVDNWFVFAMMYCMCLGIYHFGPIIKRKNDESKKEKR